MTKKEATALIADIMNCIHHKDSFRRGIVEDRAADYLKKNKWIQIHGKWVENANPLPSRPTRPRDNAVRTINIVKRKQLLALNFDEVPWSLNKLLRSSIKDSRREKKRWQNALSLAAAGKHPKPPVKGELRILVFRVRSAQAMDRSNAIGGFNKLITDNLLSKYIRKVKGLGKMEVPGALPFIYDDDMQHVYEEYVWEPSNGQTSSFSVEIWST